MKGHAKTPLVNIEAAADAFAPVIWGRGEDYAQAGMVLSMKVKGDSIVAAVAGSAATPYKVRLRIADGEIEEGECSCPFEGWCKHMAAVAIAAGDPHSETVPGLAEEEEDAEPSDEEFLAHLMRLDKEDLAGLLVERAADDERLRRRLIEISLPRGKIRTLVRRIRRDIRRAWGSPGGYIDYSESGAVAHELSEVHEAVGRLAERGHLEEAAGLLEELVEACERNIENADDSDGSIGDETKAAVRGWGNVWARIEGRDRRALAVKVFEQTRRNDYGLKDDVIPAFAGALGKSGLRELRRLLSERLAALPKKGKGDDDESWEHSSLLTSLMDVADALDDVDGYIRLCEMRRHPEFYILPIARRLLDADRAREALAY